MTNKQLAELIKQGGNDELLPVLWEKTAKLLYKMSAKTYTLYKDALKQHGIEPEDLNQECYTVLLAAVKAYDSGKGYMLTTYFGYQFKWALRELLRSSDVLDRIDTKSFDEPLTDEEDAPTRGDTVPDPKSGAGFDRVETEDYYEPLHRAIATLNPNEREALELRFFSYPNQLMKYSEISNSMDNVTEPYARQLVSKALEKLRRGKMGALLRKIYEDDYKAHPAFYGDSLATYRRYFSSGVELRAMARIRYEERQQRNQSNEPAPHIKKQ